MPIKKKLKITSIAVSIIVIITIIILLVSFNFFKISYNSNEKNEVDSELTITRDNNGIPTIYADSVNDFYFALGYLHAQDRLNVIEYLRSIATGESARFAGNDSTLLSNLSKTIGFTKNAEEITGKLKDEEILALKSYVKGINHIRNKNHVRNFIRREWRIEDVLAILSMKDWANSYLNNKELIFNLSDTKLLSSKNMFKDNRYLSFYNEDDLRYLYTLRRIKEIIEKYICTFARGNSIHITPEYSSTGNDYFLSLNYDDSTNCYPGWYPVKLVLKGKKSFAVTYSGLPFILSYKNEMISATQININADSQNFYLFETDYKDSVPRYKSAGTWKEYKSIRIPSFSDTEHVSEIKWITEKGSLFSELINTAKSDPRILVIESIQPGVEYVNLLLKIPFETDIEKVKQLVLSNDSSLKSFIITDSKKSYKIYSGMINQGDNNNRVFIDGSKTLSVPIIKLSSVKQISGIDYTGSDLVSVKDLSSNYKNIISNDFRIEKFNTILVKKKIYDIEKIKNIITDNHSVAAEKFVPLFTSLLGNNPLTSSKLSKLYFSNWDFSTKPGLQAPSIFYATLAFFITETYKDKFGKDSDFNLNSAYLLYPEIYDQCNKRITDFFDKSETPNIESKEMIFDVAFLNAMRFLNRKNGPLMENWKWGSINKSSYSIPNVRLNIFSRFFKIEDLPFSGGPDIIENISINNKFSTISLTSFHSFFNNETFRFNMNYGYSTSMFSDFYYGSKTIDSFENLDVSQQIYKTIINK